MTDQTESTQRDYGLDFEVAKRILARPGCKMTVSAEELAEWIREARARVMINSTPEDQMNPANHADQWLVEAAYFAANFEPIE